MTAQPEFPDYVRAHVEEFLQIHELPRTERLLAERTAVTWVRAVPAAIGRAYAGFSEAQLASHPASGLVLELLHRAQAHLEAAIIAFATTSATSSELLSRAGLEVSSAVEFILSGLPEARLLGYLEAAFALEHDRLSRWQQAIGANSERGRHIYDSMAERRRGEVEAMSTVVSLLRGEFARVSPGSGDAAGWPNTAAPFDATASLAGYNRFYVQMAGNVPSDAEETLRNLVLAMGDPTLMKRMAIENDSYSRFKFYFSISAFLQACAKYVERYEIRAAESVLREGQHAVSATLRAIADDLDNLTDSVP